MSCNDNYLVPGANPCNQTTGVQSIGAGTNVTIGGTATVPIVNVTAVKQATYYKSVNQNLTSGNNNITFDLTGTWNNTGGYITHTSGTTIFTVVQTGLYQLEFNISVLLNNGTWSTTIDRSVSIDITRSTQQGVLTANGLQGISNYNQQVNGTFYLIAGDVIVCRVNNPFTLGTPTPPQAQGLTSTFDLNTFFTWRFIN
jgi:hypothetical protein